MKGSDVPDSTTSKLGAQLRSVRRMRGWSLRDVAEKAGISPAYLQKLEKGQVQGPSPHMLHKLSEELRVSYPELMDLAGYVVPGEVKGDALTNAFSSEELSPDETEALVSYLAWYRSDLNKRR